MTLCRNKLLIPIFVLIPLFSACTKEAPSVEDAGTASSLDECPIDDVTLTSKASKQKLRQMQARDLSKMSWQERLMQQIAAARPISISNLSKVEQKIFKTNETLMVTLRPACRKASSGGARRFLSPVRFFKVPAPGMSLDDLSLALAAESDCIETVEIDTPVKLAEVDDPLFANQEHLEAVNFTQGMTDFNANALGEETIVAVIDSGISGTHPDLVNAFWQNTLEVGGVSSADDDDNGYNDDVRGYNFAEETADPSPTTWSDASGGEFHGTHVAGLIAATQNNATGGVGIGGNSIRLMDLNIFGSSSGAYISSAVEAVQYAVANGADVINLSIVSTDTNALRTSLAAAVSAGVFVVAAAGNSGWDLEVDGNSAYPAMAAPDIDGLLSVGATYADTLAVTNYSNFSPAYIEMMAPGSAYISGSASIGLLSTTSGTSPLYRRSEGTSMATPLVAGAAALVISYLKSQSVTYTPAQIETVMKEGALYRTDLLDYAECGAHLDLSKLYERTLEF